MPDNNGNNDQNNNDDEYEKYCYMCKRPESQAGKLITLSKGVNVCADCINKTLNQINSSPFSILGNIPGIDNMNMIFPNMDIPNSQKVKKKKTILHQLRTVRPMNRERSSHSRIFLRLMTSRSFWTSML